MSYSLRLGSTLLPTLLLCLLQTTVRAADPTEALPGVKDLGEDLAGGGRVEFLSGFMFGFREGRERKGRKSLV